MVQAFGNQFPTRAKLLPLLVGPGLPHRMGAGIDFQVDGITPPLHHLCHSKRGKGIVPPFPAFEQKLVREFDLVNPKVVLQHLMDFGVDDKHIVLMGLLLLDRYPVTDDSLFNLMDTEGQKVLNPKPRVDSHDEQEQVSFVVPQQPLDA